MKKNIIAVIPVLLSTISLFSCGGNKGVVGKEFVYSSCKAENCAQKEKFYSENNPAGATQSAVIDNMLSTLYYKGNDTQGNSLIFSDQTMYSDYQYNGKSLKCYSLNYNQIDDNVMSDNGCYVLLNDEGTDIALVDIDLASSSLKDNTFDLGGKTGKDFEGNTYSYFTSFTDTSITYDATAKELTAVFDVTYTENSDSYVCSYTLLFSQK